MDEASLGTASRLTNDVANTSALFGRGGHIVRESIPSEEVSDLIQIPPSAPFLPEDSGDEGGNRRGQNYRRVSSRK